MSAQILPVTIPRGLAAISTAAPALFVPHPKAAERFLEFFTANIRNKNTRRAYYEAVCRFSDWCEGRGLRDRAAVKPLHVAAYIAALAGELAKRTVKHHLAALRMLFDWLVVGHVLDVNPAHAVRGPKHVVKKGRTPVLESERSAGATHGDRDQLRHRPARSRVDRHHALHLRPDRRRPADERGRYFVQGRRGWVRLHEKGGKEMEAPCHHKLETYLDEYIAAAGIAGDTDGPLFRTKGRATGELHRMTQPDAYRMIQRRARSAGIKTRIGNHSLRATGITDYLKSAGTLEHAQAMANHSSPRTTKLYDRRADEVSLDECERMGI